MKRAKLAYFTVVVLFSFVIFGCISVGSSPTPRFYMLSSVDSGKINKKFDLPANLNVVIGPVLIPGYQDRPQIVTKSKTGMLNFAQFDRWGEPLDSGLGRLIMDSLLIMLPATNFQVFPCNFAIPLDYQVIVDVAQLDNELDKGMFLAVQWTIIDSKTDRMLLTKRSEFRQVINPHNYSGLAQALSMSVTSLSSEIAENLANLASQPKTKVKASADK